MNSSPPAERTARVRTAAALTWVLALPAVAGADDVGLALVSRTITYENRGAVSLPVRPRAASDAATSIRWRTVDDTAVAPGDYVGAEGTLEWGPGDVGTRYLEVPLVHDADGAEGNESFSVAFDGGRGIAAPSPTTVVVVDVRPPTSVVVHPRPAPEPAPAPAPAPEPEPEPEAAPGPSVGLALVSRTITYENRGAVSLPVRPRAASDAATSIRWRTVDDTGRRAGRLRRRRGHARVGPRRRRHPLPRGPAGARRRRRRGQRELLGRLRRGPRHRRALAHDRRRRGRASADLGRRPSATGARARARARTCTCTCTGARAGAGART